MDAKRVAWGVGAAVCALILVSTLSAFGHPTDLPGGSSLATQGTPATPDPALVQEGTPGRHAFESRTLSALDFVPYSRAVAWDLETGRVVVRVFTCEEEELPPGMEDEIRARNRGARRWDPGCHRGGRVLRCRLWAAWLLTGPPTANRIPHRDPGE